MCCRPALKMRCGITEARVGRVLRTDIRQALQRSKMVTIATYRALLRGW